MHERISVSAICFPGASLAEMRQHWAALKPQRVSFLSTQLLDAHPGDVSSILSEGSYKVETITHVFTSTLDAPQETLLKERERLSRLIGIAQNIDAKSIYMLTGQRGRLDWEGAAEAFAAAIAPCREEAREAGVLLAVENALPLIANGHIAHTLRDTTTLAQIAGIGVCIDVFGVWTEAGLNGLLARAAPLCAVVQVSDYVLGDKSLPARAVPGDGVIPLEHIFERLFAAGYDGNFDLELLGPRIDTEGHREAARRAAEATGDILRKLGV
jgi:sugar phosphate isomerase/epimerase